MTHDSQANVHRTLRVLMLYAAVSTVAIAFLLLDALGGAGRSTFDEINVRRINVLNASGLPALSISITDSTVADNVSNDSVRAH